MKYFSYHKNFGSLEAATTEVSNMNEAIQPLCGIKTLKELVSSKIVLSFRWEECEEPWEAVGYTPDGARFILMGDETGPVEAHFAYYASKERELPEGWTPINAKGEGKCLAHIAITRDVRELPRLNWRYDREGGCVGFFSNVDPAAILAAIAEEKSEMVLGIILAMTVSELRHYQFSFRHVLKREDAHLRACVMAWKHAMEAIACACAEKLGIQAQGNHILWVEQEDVVEE